mmetsp:Transcript_3167/g.4970  ORF Transcript_3167/g.4970 Transcript_3167/m.4970 type:complete len:251 (+) Transcript_3167:124-876(+)|eukprot:CAMPEP_0196811574 /NCGR_PEP_ID=MMETSP1362-20130617/18740_1 /TAXON_ID=163516 /ORGANISM="Leptocylindrus danicus, Strain CCMP1856" /LENGTH=250 /DNA_ID=CAMNT_0042186909 /DNA_START=97 /DNA_END=849 /DNA_ORIENTATION=+
MGKAQHNNSNGLFSVKLLIIVSVLSTCATCFLTAPPTTSCINNISRSTASSADWRRSLNVANDSSAANKRFNDNNYSTCSNPNKLPNTKKKKMKKQKRKFQTFDEMLSIYSDRPLLVGFQARWCGPCKLLDVELRQAIELLRAKKERSNDDGDEASVATNEERAQNHIADGSESVDRRLDHRVHSISDGDNDDIIFMLKVDAEKFPSIAQRFQIEALPVAILFVKGQPVHKFEGVLSAETILEELCQHIL